MTTTVRSLLAGLLSGGAVVAFVLLFVLARARIGPPRLLAALAGIGVIAVLAVIGIGGLELLFQPPEEWWLERVETALEDVWNGYADAVLIGGLLVVGVGVLGRSLSNPTGESAYGLLVVAFICFSAALFALVGSRYS